MMQMQLQPLPKLRDVVRAKFVITGRAVQLPVIAVTVIVAIATVIIFASRDAVPIDFVPEQQMLPAIIGLLLPLLVWPGGVRSGTGLFWTLPFDRQRHALARVFAGWTWLMILIAAFGLWQAIATLVTGGSFLDAETLRVLSSYSPAPEVMIDPAAPQTVQWMKSAWLWLAPFTGATVLYVLVSALILGVRSPLKWVAGFVFLFFLVGAVLSNSNEEAVRLAPSRAFRAAFAGPYGLDAVMTARTESLKTLAPLANGERMMVWLDLPNTTEWAIATLAWLTVGLIALWAATWRHRESR
jgi:hypothetical protein